MVPLRKVSRFALNYADLCVLPHTNEYEYNSYFGNKENEAMIDRIMHEEPLHLIPEELQDYFERASEKKDNSIKKGCQVARMAVSCEMEMYTPHWGRFS